MAENNTKENETGPEVGRSEEQGKPRIDWEDPSVPIGNAPPLPRWPVVAFAFAWVAFVVFLALMAVSRGDAMLA